MINIWYTTYPEFKKFFCDKSQSSNDEELAKFLNRNNITKIVFTDKTIANADFSCWAFPCTVDFSNVKFDCEANFRWVKFLSGIIFNNVYFEGKADFTEANFKGKASFESAIFTGETYFKKSMFMKQPNFDKTSFQGEVSFRFSSFYMGIDLNEAIFTKNTTLIMNFELLEKIMQQRQEYKNAPQLKRNLKKLKFI